MSISPTNEREYIAVTNWLDVERRLAKSHAFTWIEGMLDRQTNQRFSVDNDTVVRSIKNGVARLDLEDIPTASILLFFVEGSFTLRRDETWTLGLQPSEEGSPTRVFTGFSFGHVVAAALIEQKGALS
jgi:hypothetical protein